MTYNSVSSGPSSEVIWKCWFTRTEENILEQGGWATSVLSSNWTIGRPLANRENQFFKLKPPFWRLLICQDCVICQFWNLFRTFFLDLYFSCLFTHSFVAHFIAFFSWNCGWLTFQERDQLKMQSVVIE